jgi:hypothetical protein
LFEAKKHLLESTSTERHITFVLWGGHAKKLHSVIAQSQRNIYPDCPYTLVAADHPAVESFHKVSSFDLIALAQQKALQAPILWKITAGSLVGLSPMENTPPSPGALDKAVEPDEGEILAPQKRQRDALSSDDVDAGPEPGIKCSKLPQSC